jgi:hypothetical protein
MKRLTTSTLAFAGVATLALAAWFAFDIQAQPPTTPT